LKSSNHDQTIEILNFILDKNKNKNSLNFESSNLYRTFLRC